MSNEPKDRKATIQFGNNPPIEITNVEIISDGSKKPTCCDFSNVDCSVEFNAEFNFFNEFVYMAMVCNSAGVDSLVLDAIGTHGERLSSVTTSDITPEGIELAAELAVKAAVNRANGKGRF